MHRSNKLLTWAARKPLWRKIDSYIAYLPNNVLVILPTVLKVSDKNLKLDFLLTSVYMLFMQMQINKFRKNPEGPTEE